MTYVGHGRITAGTASHKASTQRSAHTKADLVSALIFLIPATAAFGANLGSVSLIGQQWFPFKIVVPVLALIALTRALSELLRPGRPAWFLLMLTVWGVVALSWTDSPTDGRREVAFLLFATLLVAALPGVIRDQRRLRTLLRGWIAASVVVLLFLAREIFLNRPIDVAFTRTNRYRVGDYVVGTFSNPNNLGAFVILALPFLVLSFGATGRQVDLGMRERRLALALTPPMLLAMVLSASRISVIALGVGLLAYGIAARRLHNFRRYAIAGTVLAMGALVFAVSTDQTIIAKFAEQFSPSDDGDIDSIGNRVNLVKNGFHFFLESSGRGIGPAAFESAIANGEGPYRQGVAVVNSHNLWIEVLTQYGIVGAALLLLAIAAILPQLHILRTQRRSTASREVGAVLTAALCAYVFAALASSSYLTAPENWVFLASIIAVSRVATSLGEAVEPGAFRPRTRAATTR